MSEELDPVERLVEQAQEPEKSFRRTFHLYYARVDAFFLRKGFSPEETQDLTQETFLRLFKSIGTFRHESRFDVWIFGVANIVYKSELRRRYAERRRGIDLPLDEPSDTLPQLPARETNVLDQVIAREQSARLQAALQGLPPQMRMCCVLRYERGLKYHEIATLMKISIETVKAHLHQARKRLSTELEGKEPA